MIFSNYYLGISNTYHNILPKIRAVKFDGFIVFWSFSEGLYYDLIFFIFETRKATYKIPGFGEMAKKFTVKFYRDGHIHHPERIYGSKAIGEPPLFLGSSVYYAIVDAVHQARQEKKEWF